MTSSASRQAIVPRHLLLASAILRREMKVLPEVPWARETRNAQALGAYRAHGRTLPDAMGKAAKNIHDIAVQVVKGLDGIRLR